MKKFIILSLLSMFACNSFEKEEETDFDWLLGDWIRTNEKADKQTYESWIKISPQDYLGNAYTIKNNDTIWQEYVKLAENEKSWSFAVTQKGDSEITVFNLTNITDSTFSCENHQNEFPNIIRYLKDGNTLKAEIEGGEMKIPYEFEKINKPD